MVVAETHHPAQFFGGPGPHHQGGRHRRQDRGVIGVGEAVGLAHHDLLLAQELLKFLNQGLTDHMPSGGMNAPHISAEFIFPQALCQEV